MVYPEDWENPIGMSQMLGNSMATNVLLRVMVPLLRTARPDVSIQDPWFTGRIQRLLRRTARDPYDCTSVPPVVESSCNPNGEERITISKHKTMTSTNANES